jgi:hypothetical protein
VVTALCGYGPRTLCNIGIAMRFCHSTPSLQIAGTSGASPEAFSCDARQCMPEVCIEQQALGSVRFRDQPSTSA